MLSGAAPQFSLVGLISLVSLASGAQPGRVQLNSSCKPATGRPQSDIRRFPPQTPEMEHMLEPYYAISTDLDADSLEGERTPYRGTSRYAGAPFVTYPAQQELWFAGAIQSNSLNLAQHLHLSKARPLAQLEETYQTWLFFGLLAEFLSANAADDRESEPDIIDWMYESILVTEGDKTFLKLNSQTLEKFRVLAEERLPTEIEARKKHFHYMNVCLYITSNIILTVPREFNYLVKNAIATLGEILFNTTLHGLRALGDVPIFGLPWAVKYLDPASKVRMRRHGWCASDITRCESKFIGLQSLSMLKRMDRSKPSRDHSKCTERACTYYQIGHTEYKVGHRDGECTCEELSVDPDALTKILADGERVPLLRFKGGLDDLSVELVPSTETSEYIALSHIWADGLGNPHSNSLHRCMLLDLRAKIDATAAQAGMKAEPLIWLDTLCCPAQNGEGKQKAIAKIRQVYQNATQVLVLDAGLMSYASEIQDSIEQCLRIFTSGWVRRLWTLQEGCLAPSLYFQFADKAINLHELHRQLLDYRNSAQHHALIVDIDGQIQSLDVFFRSNKYYNENKLATLGDLDRALQFRGVSVASDEPLCIGTLMSCDLATILAESEHQKRMQKIWQSIGESHGGIPSQILFFEDTTLDIPGWRWAPLTFLTSGDSIFGPETRIKRWQEKYLGKPTTSGLRVNFPGFHITGPTFSDGRPANPWPGLERLPEDFLRVKDKKTGRWWFIADRGFAYAQSKWTTDQDRIAYNKLDRFPMWTLAQTDRLVGICNTGDDGKREDTAEAILALPQELSSTDEENRAEPIPVHRRLQAIVTLADPDLGYISDVISGLAMKLRDDPLTDAHLALWERLSSTKPSEPPSSNNDDAKPSPAPITQDPAYVASRAALRQKMRELAAAAAARDERFVNAVQAHLGADMVADVWVMIQDWFWGGWELEWVEGDRVSGRGWCVD